MVEWRSHYSDARVHRDDPALDLDDFIGGLGLSESESEALRRSLLPENTILPEPTQTQNNASRNGIYQQYLDKITVEEGLEVSDSIGASVNETRERMELRSPDENRTGYGLVMGRIQSGKTAHMIGVSLHAMDPSSTPEPFDTVIFLSGLIDVAKADSGEDE